MSVDTHGASQIGAWIRQLANRTCALVPELMEWRVAHALQRRGMKLLAAHGVPGMQLCLRVGQREPLDIAMGDARLSHTKGLSGKVPMTTATRFVTGSLSKPMTAAYVLMLVQDGVLTLDEPLGELLDEIALNPRRESEHGVWKGFTREISVRQLLTHTSGIESLHPPHLPQRPQLPNLDRGESHTKEELRTSWACAMARGERILGVMDSDVGNLGENASDQTPDWPGIAFLSPPGTQTCYSGANYLLLEFVIEKVLSRIKWARSEMEPLSSFAHHAKTRLFEPLGLRSCSFERGVAHGGDVAEFHTQDVCGNIEQISRMGVCAMGSSGFTGSSRDVVTIVSEVLRCSRRVEPGVVDASSITQDTAPMRECRSPEAQSRHLSLNPGLARLLFQVPAGQDSSARTFTHGFHLYKDRDASLLDHGGERPGYRGVIHVYPREQVVVCIMTNGEKGAKVIGSILGLIKGMMKQGA
jgi:CubicO group peptidase (beta-lactamase class C family)